MTTATVEKTSGERITLLLQAFNGEVRAPFRRGDVVAVAPKSGTGFSFVRSPRRNVRTTLFPTLMCAVPLPSRRHCRIAASRTIRYRGGARSRDAASVTATGREASPEPGIKRNAHQPVLN